MSLQPNFEVLWIEQVLKNQVKPMLPSTLSTSLPSKDTKKASETAYSQIRCQRCFIFSLLNSPQPLISRGFPSFPTSSRMVSRQNVLFVIYSVKLQLCPIWNILFIPWRSIRIHYFNIHNLLIVLRQSDFLQVFIGYVYEALYERRTLRCAVPHYNFSLPLCGRMKLYTIWKICRFYKNLKK